MATSEPSPTPQVESHAAIENPIGSVPGESSTRPGEPLRLWTRVLVASCLAALVSWLIGETSVVQVLPQRGQFVAAGKTVEGVPPRAREHARVATTARIHLVAGTMLGMALGFLGGRFRRSPRAAILGAALGLGLGAIGGGAVSYWGLPVARRAADSIAEEPLSALLIRASIWCVIGGSAGLALGVGMGGRSRMIRTLLGGALGGMLGAGAYELLGAFLFPLEPTNQLIPTVAPARLLALVLASTFTATVATAASGGPPVAKRTDSTT